MLGWDGDVSKRLSCGNIIYRPTITNGRIGADALLFCIEYRGDVTSEPRVMGGL